MPLLIKKPGAPSIKPGVPAPTAKAPAASPTAPKPTVKTPVAAAAKTASTPAAAPKPGLSFLKRGNAAQEQLKVEEKKIEARRSEIYRYFVTKESGGDLTFLDGDIVNGVLDVPYYHEHNVKMNGKWNNFFICTQDEEPCPICEGGLTPSYVGILTVIDHSEYVSKKDGKVHKDNVKLFVAKRDTIKMLQTLALKRGGLRGCRFDVTRVGDKAPAVDSNFDFTEKLTPAQLAAKYKDEKGNPIGPVDYDNYLMTQYQPAKMLRGLGFGSTGGNNPIGSEQAASEEGGEQYQM